MSEAESDAASDAEVLWRPPADARETSRLGAYLAWLERERGLSFDGYEDLWRWSVDDLEGFWSSVWEYFDVRAHTPYETVLDGRAMPGARWFPGATLNYAEHALRLDGVDGDPVLLYARSQTREPADITVDHLRRGVARAAAGLRRLGVGKGDRVAAYLPNVPETLVLFLAAASVGAIFSSCAPEFGTRSVVDRWQQIEPVVLVTVDGYRYGAKAVDRRDEVAAIRAALPSVRHTVLVPYLEPDSEIPDAITWAEMLEGDSEFSDLTYEPVPFDHPLYVLYSSGTTGLPKPIVHGHGGILLEHLKILGLQSELGPGSRFFWFSTTGWMMWNYLVSGLLVGASVVMFDGNPAHPDLGALWRLAGETGMTYFGTSAPFLMGCRKAGVEPREVADLSALRGMGSTGSPLPAEGFRWVYEHVVAPGDPHPLQLASVSGGTDVCTAFVGGSPLLPVRAGEIACRALGARVEAYDEDGRSVVGERGELVVTAPMPSMPVGLWGDDGSRYREAYYGTFEGVWRHGDWITIREDGACEITGRSDATLNRGGVRLGTSEFYATVESIDEVADSLVVHLEDGEGGSGRLLLFVVPADGATLDDALRRRIATELRSSLSPRHVPDETYEVQAVPRTLSGKKLEVPVKRILTGTPVDRAAARGALANPESLNAYEELARRLDSSRS